MSQVNSDVKEAVDTFDYIINFIAGIWNALPVEVRVYLVIMFTISIVLQTVKKAFLADMKPRQRKVRRLWVVSIIISGASSILGYYLFKTIAPEWVWWVSGLTAGTISMGVHRVAVDSVWPAISTIFSAIKDRLLLAWRGLPKED